VAITTSTDEAGEDGERLSGSDEGTDQVLTVGDDEVADDHLGAAEKAMIDDLEQDVQQLTVAVEGQGQGQVDGIDGDDLVEGQDPVAGEESRWRHRLVLYENDVQLYEGAKAEGFTGKWTDELFRQLGTYAIGVLQGMLVSGEIYGLVAEIGRPVFPTLRQRETLVLLKGERETLAFDVTAEAFVLWMRYEASGTGWNNSLGKALPSYLVEQCKWTFTAVFRDWQKARGGEVAASVFGLNIDQIAEMRGVHGARGTARRSRDGSVVRRADRGAVVAAEERPREDDRWEAAGRQFTQGDCRGTRRQHDTQGCLAGLGAHQATRGE